MTNDTYKINSSNEKLVTPTQLRSEIKNRAKEYLDWMRRNSNLLIPEDQQILSDKYDFVFNDDYRHLNFHPGIM